MKKLILISSLMFFFFCNDLNSQVILTQGHQPEIKPMPSGQVNDQGISGSEWKCDSIWHWGWDNNSSSWRKSNRTIKSYDNGGKIISNIYVYWDFNLSQWTGIDKDIYAYYNTDTLKSTLRYKWNKTDNSWIENAHTFYLTDGRDYENESKNYDQVNNVFTSGSKTNVTYTLNSTERISQSLEILTMTWKNSSRNITSVNASGNYEFGISQVWNNSDWLNYEKTEIIYDTEGQATRESYFLWNPILGAWVNRWKIEYEYNLTGWKIKSSLMDWDEISQTWMQVSRFIFHYDENGNNTVGEYDSFDDLTQTWIHDQQETRSFYQNNAENEYIRYLYNVTQSNFVEFEYKKFDSSGKQNEEYHKDINLQNFEYSKGYRTVWTYNAQELQIERRGQTLEIPGMTWTDSWRERELYDENLNLTFRLYDNYDNVTWTPSSKDEYFYSTLIGIGPEPVISDICDFSSPLKAGDKISCNALPLGNMDIFIINMQGQVVSKQFINGTGQIDVPATLTTGIYILSVRSGSKHYSGKITVVN